LVIYIVKIKIDKILLKRSQNYILVKLNIYATCSKTGNKFPADKLIGLAFSDGKMDIFHWLYKILCEQI